jgi:hypothetical protein
MDNVHGVHSKGSMDECGLGSPTNNPMKWRSSEQPDEMAF